MDKLSARQNRRNIHVFDNTNIEEFFRQPSPDELKVTSEKRMLEVIEDLKKQTSRELENWSQGQFTTYAPLPALKVLKSNDSIHKKGFHGGDMVSSPISLTSPLAESNIKSASRPQLTGRVGQGTADTQSTKQTKEREKQHSAEEKDSLPLSDKPSFQSFLKRVAKTPPPPTSVIDFAYIPNTLPAVLRPASRWPEIDQTDQHDVSKICVRLPKSSAPPPPPKFATQRNLYQRKEESKERLVTPDMAPKTLKSRPRSNSLPAFTVKRKPLPKDSPLLAPKSSIMKRSPTSDDIMFDEPVDGSSTNKSRSRSESEADRFDRSLMLPPILTSTLLRGKSIGKRLKSQMHISRRI